jgi:hypothetical protein
METNARRPVFSENPNFHEVHSPRAPARTEIAREPPFPPPPILSISDCRTMGVHHGLMAFPVLGGEAKA